MQDQRPGQSTSREGIYKETNNFLGNVQNSNYASVLNLVHNEDQVYLNGLNTTSNGLTMARPAILPLTITMASASRKRLQFTLLVNPESINHGKTHTTGAALTRQGYVTQYWGPNQDLLTGNGRSAAFMTPETGLTSKADQRSFGFQNFMSLVSAYRNNGYEFLDMTDLSLLVTRVIHIVHGIEISYDNQIFMGHFNNFTIDQLAENPFNINYNFEFVVSTLNTTYNEIRGHFIPIPPIGGDSNAPAVTLEQLKQQAKE